MEGNNLLDVVHWHYGSDEMLDLIASWECFISAVPEIIFCLIAKT